MRDKKGRHSAFSILMIFALFLGPDPSIAQQKPDLVLQSGHSKIVWATAFSGDGRLLASSGLDQTIRFWDILSGYEVRMLAGSDGGVPDIAFSPDGRTLASACQDKIARLWDVETGKVKSLLAGHPDRVEKVKFSPDGRWLVTQGYRVGMLWDVASGRAFCTLENVAPTARFKLEDIAFSRDGRWAAWKLSSPSALYLWEMGTAKKAVKLTTDQQSLVYDGLFSLSDDGSWIAASLGDGSLKVWKTVTAKEAYSLNESPAKFGKCSISRDGRRLAAAASDGRIKIIDLADGKERYSLEGHQGRIAGLAFSPDGSLLASGGDNKDQAVRIWDAGSGRLIQTLDGKLGSASVLVFGPGNKYLLTGTDSKKSGVWDLAAGTLLNTADIGAEGLVNIDRCVSPDWKLYASIRSVSSNDNRDIRISELFTGRVLRTMTGRTAGVANVAVSPDGRWLASCIGSKSLGGDDNSIRIWDLMTGSLTHQIPAAEPGLLAFSANGKILASAGEFSGDSINIWEPLSGSPAGETLAHPTVIAMAFSPQGDKLLTGSGGNEDAEDDAKLWEASTGRLIRTFDHGRWVQAVGFSPDGQRIVTAGGSMIRIWNAETGAEIKTTYDEYEFASRKFLAISPDLKWAAAEDEHFDESRFVLDIFDVSSGKIARSVNAHTSFIRSAAFSPDSRWIATASMDGTAKNWEVGTGRLNNTFAGHSNSVESVVFSPGGRWIITGSIDGSIRVWDPASSREAALLSAMRESKEWIVASPTGLFDGSPEAMRKLVTWRFGSEVVPLEIFFNEFYYPELLADIVTGKSPRAPRDLIEVDRRQPRLKIAAVDPAGSGPAGVAATTVKIRIEVAQAPPDDRHPSGSGAQDLRLFRNGSLVKAWRGNLLQGQSGDASVEATIAVVPGENRLTAYAFNASNIKSSDAEWTIAGAPSLKRPGTAYILVVGIDKYANAGFDLKYAVADARSFGEELLSQQSSLRNYEKVEVIPLYDRDATKANILKLLAGFGGAIGPDEMKASPPVFQKIARLQPSDALIIFFAGHGTAAGSRFYLIPHDLGYAGEREAMDAAALKAVCERSISDLDLERSFEPIDAGLLLLVLDACNSGQALEAEEKRRGPMNSKGLAQLAYEKGMYILAAAQGYQAAQEVAELGHGLLTYALVEEGMKTPAADISPSDGRVMLREWLDYASVRVPQMQQSIMQEARKVGREVTFVDGETKVQELGKRSLQRPRVFYRREPESNPLVVAKPPAKR